MSYHDQLPPTLTFGDSSKKNYYDELNFWLSRAKNLEILLTEAIGHVEDFESVMRVIKESNVEGADFDAEHLEGLQKFLRIAGQALNAKKAEKSD